MHVRRAGVVLKERQFLATGYHTEGTILHRQCYGANTAVTAHLAVTTQSCVEIPAQPPNGLRRLAQK